MNNSASRYSKNRLLGVLDLFLNTLVGKLLEIDKRFAYFKKSLTRFVTKFQVYKFV